MGILAMTWPNTSGGCRMAHPIKATKQSHSATTTTSVLVSRLFVVCVISSLARSFRHAIHFEITLGRYPESIGDPIKEGKHRGYVHSLSNLGLTPAMIAEYLHIFRCRTIRGFRNFCHILEEYAFRSA
jgi:hypothetical protein